MNEIIKQIIDERKRQLKKWGEHNENHPSIDEGAWMDGELSAYYGILPEEDAKAQCDFRFGKKQGTWADIFLEEVSEAIHAPSPEKMKEELIQVIAVGIAWVQSIDRNEIQKEHKPSKEFINFCSNAVDEILNKR